MNFKKVMVSVGLTSFRFHDLRHLCAVNSLKLRDDIKTAQHILGHANVSTTLEIYTDLRKNHQIKNVGKFARSKKKLQEAADKKEKVRQRLPNLTTNLTTKYTTTDDFD